MKSRMRYANYDLGEQQEGSTVVVRLQGSSANVMLLDSQNFQRYRADQRFEYAGGFRRRTPVRLQVPHDGHWYAVLDLGGHGGRVRGAVSVVNRDGEPVPITADGEVVESDAEQPQAAG